MKTLSVGISLTHYYNIISIVKHERSIKLHLLVIKLQTSNFNVIFPAIIAS